MPKIYLNRYRKISVFDFDRISIERTPCHVNAVVLLLKTPLPRFRTNAFGRDYYDNTDVTCRFEQKYLKKNILRYHEYPATKHKLP